MEVGKEELKQLYSNKSDAELLELHANGTLSDLAYEVIESEMRSRQLSFPARPATIDTNYPASKPISRWKLIIIILLPALTVSYFVFNYFYENYLYEHGETEFRTLYLKMRPAVYSVTYGHKKELKQWPWQGKSYQAQVGNVKYYLDKYQAHYPEGKYSGSVRHMLATLKMIDLVSTPKSDARAEYKDYLDNRAKLDRDDYSMLYFVTASIIQKQYFSQQNKPPDNYMLQLIQCGIEGKSKFAPKLRQKWIDRADYFIRVSDEELNSLALRHGWLPVKEGGQNLMYLKTSFHIKLLDEKTYSGFVPGRRNSVSKSYTIKRYKLSLSFQLFKEGKKIWESGKFTTTDDPFPEELEVTSYPDGPKDNYTYIRRIKYGNKTKMGLVEKSIKNLSIPKLESNRKFATASCGNYPVRGCSEYYDLLAGMIDTIYNGEYTDEFDKTLKEISASCHDPQVTQNVKYIQQGAFFKLKW
jgi:hypothetical protein